MQNGEHRNPIAILGHWLALKSHRGARIRTTRITPNERQNTMKLLKILFPDRKLRVQKNEVHELRSHCDFSTDRWFLLGQSPRDMVAEALGFDPSVGFVTLVQSRPVSVGFSAGKPEEIRLLKSRCESKGVPMSAALAKF